MTTTSATKWLAIIIIVVTAIMIVANSANASDVVLEDTVYINTDNGGTTHAMRVLIPDGEAAWQFDFGPDIDGLDIGWRLPKVDWGKSYKLQPRAILQFRDEQGLDGVKFQAMVTGEKGWWLTGIRFADGQKASHFNQLQWNVMPGKDITASAVAVLTGNFSSHGRTNVNLGPALTWHIGKGIGDLQAYYGLGVGSSADTAWLQFDFYIPTD